MKKLKTPDQQLAGTDTAMVDEFLALLLELESLNASRLADFSEEIRVTSRRSHVPNKIQRR